jgi:hypothetical protein
LQPIHVLGDRRRRGSLEAEDSRVRFVKWLHIRVIAELTIESFDGIQGLSEAFHQLPEPLMTN